MTTTQHPRGRIVLAAGVTGSIGLFAAVLPGRLATTLALEARPSIARALVAAWPAFLRSPATRARVISV